MVGQDLNNGDPDHGYIGFELPYWAQKTGPPVAELPDVGGQDLDNGDPDHGAVAQAEHEDVHHEVQQRQPAYKNKENDNF